MGSFLGSEMSRHGFVLFVLIAGLGATGYARAAAINGFNGASGPALGSATNFQVLAPTPEQQDFYCNPPSSPVDACPVEGRVALDVAFDSVGIIDLVFSVESGGGNPALWIMGLSIDNNTPSPWAGISVQAGYGVGAEFDGMSTFVPTGEPDPETGLPTIGTYSCCDEKAFNDVSSLGLGFFDEGLYILSRSLPPARNGTIQLLFQHDDELIETLSRPKSEVYFS